jgi:hypothetical protein
MELVALTADQSARTEVLPEDCTIVGVQEGCPLVRQAGGEVELLESDGHLKRAEHSVRAVTPYLEVGAAQVKGPTGSVLRRRGVVAGRRSVVAVARRTGR